MSYLALYRRFRPEGFGAGYVGQEHIVKTLTNQIKTGNIGHAYLFCGARGTGKTSTAKIFAKAINCLNPQNGSPCGECEVCQKLSMQNNLDVLEMDGASNNKVEHIRELRESVQYPPTVGKYKVYIIDEVHMLTTEAFNALLKTLEEPPRHAVFILATTEVHKLPSTILSRCMRFDFKLIPTKEIAEQIKRIYKEIGKAYEDGAIELIAKAGEGSMRDALSIADICVSFTDGELKYEDVLKVLGATDSDKIAKLVTSILKSDTGELLTETDELLSLGKSVGVLNRDVIECLRNLIVIKTAKNANEILAMPKERFSELEKIANQTTEERLLRALEIFTESETELKYSTHPRIIFETSAMRATRTSSDYGLDALTARVSELEKMLSGGIKITSERAEAPRQEPKVEPKQEPKQEPKVEQAKEQDEESELPPIESLTPPEPEEGESYAVKKPIIKAGEKVAESKVWGTLLRQLREKGNIVLWAACQEMGAKVDGERVIIYTKEQSEYNLLTKEDNKKTIDEILSELGGYKAEINDSSSKEIEDEQFKEDVDELKRRFGDIIDVK